MVAVVSLLSGGISEEEKKLSWLGMNRGHLIAQ